MSAKIEIANIKDLDLTELKIHLLALLKEQFDLRMQKQGGQLTDTSKLKKIKKSIARVQTIIVQKQIN